MQRVRFLFALAWIFIAFGCGSTASQGSAGQPPPGQPAPPRIAGAPLPEPVPAAEEAPPLVFAPKSHPPRQRYGAAPALNLKSLPALKLRLDQCFGVKKKEEAQPIAQGPQQIAAPAGNVATGAGGGGYPVGGKGQAAPAKKAESRAKAPSGGAAAGAAKSAPTPATAAPAADALGGAEGYAAAPPPASQPMAQAPAAEPTMPADADRSAPGAGRKEKLADDKRASRRDREEAEAPSEQADSASRIATAGDETQAAPAEPAREEYEDWGAAVYLSNDDTMSLSSAQRVIYAIDNFLPLPAEHIRPHELLNYFSFATAPVAGGNDFSVEGEVAPDPRQEGIYTLGLAVEGRPVDKISRRNAAITLVVDRSGSMRDEGRMDYLKQGLKRMLDELKTGDIVHVVIFDQEVCAPLENFVVGRDDRRKLERVIDAVKPRGSTDLHRGLSRGYEIADRAYQPNYSNRVVLITDALANTGVTDEQTISMISRYFDSRRIRLSGVGVGREFNDSLLDRLTERGKGAYVFLGSPAEVDAVFGARFISLIETTALGVHFRLHLPPSLRMNVFYGEESSTVREDVQEVHYFANTSQLFLSDLMARNGRLRPEDEVMLTIDYRDPETNEPLVEEYAFNLGAISTEARNVKKARVIMAWIDMLAAMASRPRGFYYEPGLGGWADAEGWQQCEDGRAELNRLSAEVRDDPEIRRVLELWDKHCSRFERPRQPVKRQIAAPKDKWPGASPNNR